MFETADEPVPALLEPLPDVKEEKHWSVALETRDCKRLMELLHQNPQLWLQSGPEGRNVFHVAVMQGCVKLLKQVLEAAPDNGTPLEFQKKVKKLLYAKDGRCRADAFNLAEVLGIPKVIELLKSFETVPTNESMHGSSHGTDSHMTDATLHSDQDKPIYNDSDDEDEINKLIEELLRSESRTSLEQGMKEDVDFNFEEERKGLIFHFACKRAKTNHDFIESVKQKAEEKGLSLKLFNQMDAQGRPPLHVATDFCGGGELDGIQALLERMPAACVNGLDAAGRTPLLRAAANGMNISSSKLAKVLANNKLTDLNAKWPGKSGATALHVAVLHNHAHTAKYLLEATRTEKTDAVKREEIMEREIKVFKYQRQSKWTPLELAAVMGRFSVLLQLLQAPEKSRKSICDTRCLHLAAAAGDPRSIQALLMNRSDDLHNFECNKDFKGYSCLHFAVNATLPHQPSIGSLHRGVKAIDPAFDRFLAFSDFASIYWLEKELTAAASKGPQKAGMTVIGYGGKKTCTNLLLQAGVDIWSSTTLLQAVSDVAAKASDGAHTVGKGASDASAKEWDGGSADAEDDELLGNFHNPAVPDPGVDACDDDRLWWYDVVARDTLEAKNNFNAAGNATAVVATLVATASFVGPFSPPLGYVADAANELQVLMTSPPIRIFMTSNSVSFYLAIASLMLAIMPSLPMPQEGQREELHRSERTVALAISVLLVAILGNLIAFTSCLVAVLPENSYWGYKFYPAFVGGLVCILVILVFFLRLLRLVFKRNARIKSFYRLFGKL